MLTKLPIRCTQEMSVVQLDSGEWGSEGGVWLVKEI